MKLIRPTKITDAVLQACSVLENEVPAWSAGTSYLLGQKVMLTSTHRVYQALQGDAAQPNLNQDPALKPAFWLDISPTNRWAMFDEVVGTATSAVGPLTFTLRTPGVCTAIAMLDVQASSVKVEVRMGTTLMYSKTTVMSGASNTADWYSYYFSPASSKTVMVLTDLPAFSGVDVTVTVSGTNVKVGTCILGKVKTLGNVKYGMSMSISDYSLKTRDAFGNYTIAERPFSKRSKFNIEIPHEQVDSVYSTLASLRATPVLYAGTEDFESSYVYGFYKDFDIVIPYPTYAECSIELEGLT